MADLTQTAANVGLSAAGGSIRIVQVGEAITQGQPLYLNSTDNKHYKTDVNDTAVKANAVGIAMTPAATDGYVAMAGPGCTVDLGATLSVGVTYVVSEAGAIGPSGDQTTGDFPTSLGIATAADSITLDINAGGIVIP